MTGVEILAIGEMGINECFNWSAAIFGGLTVGIIASLILGAAENDLRFSLFIAPSVCLLAGVILGFGCPAYQDMIPTYKVTISDEVSMNEFMDKYEILNQDGKIYTVKERKEE
jgi:hypothetical protein